jgi:hypothetical protein
MKRVLVFTIVLLLTSLAWTAESKTSLPKVFAGWQLQSVETATDPAKADPAYADLLREFGFNEVDTAQYTKPGRSMTVKAARFNDTSGAYGAYTFYRAPEMIKEQIGDQAASNNGRVLIQRGNFLVDVKVDRVTAMTAGELRDLAASLPVIGGSASNLPPVVAFLPSSSMVPESSKYVAGPAGLGRLDSPVPPEQIDFSTGAEIAAADYRTGQGTAKLLVISYPTPAMAGSRLRTIEQWRGAPAVYAKRSGRLVAIVTGQMSDAEAKTLLGSVNYDADVTWNQPTKNDLRNNIGSLLVNVILLISILFGLAIVAGLAFGGLRLILKKLFPDRVFDRSDDIDIIRLDIGK